jgi:ribulose-phosphate 3-epimerase
MGILFRIESSGAKQFKHLVIISKIFFDVHLKLNHPDYFIIEVTQASADLVSIHLESPCNVRETLQTIRVLGKQVGVAMNLEMARAKFCPHLDDSDLVLLMGVHPGFCGQKFIQSSFAKIVIIHK